MSNLLPPFEPISSGEDNHQSEEAKINAYADMV
jgi:hypothetical protein